MSVGIGAWWEKGKGCVEDLIGLAEFFGKKQVNVGFYDGVASTATAQPASASATAATAAGPGLSLSFASSIHSYQFLLHCGVWLRCTLRCFSDSLARCYNFAIVEWKAVVFSALFPIIPEFYFSTAQKWQASLGFFKIIFLNKFLGIAHRRDQTLWTGSSHVKRDKGGLGFWILAA